MTLSIRKKVILTSLAILFATLAATTTVSSIFFMREYSATLKSRAFLIGGILKYQLEKLLKFDITLNGLIGFNEQCNEIVNNYKGISYVIVMDSNGKVLFHDYYKNYKQHIKEVGIASILSKDNNIVQQVKIGHEKYYNFIIPVHGPRQLPIAAVIIGFPTSLIAQKTIQMVGYSVLAAIAFLALGSIALIILLRVWVTTPLVQLLKAISKIRSKGTGSSQLVAIKSNDEFGELGQSFNEMVLQLNESQAQLQKHNQELELKVQQSTAHLQEANDKLQQDIKIRLQAEKEIIRQREELRGLATRLAEVEESERQQLARELHDDVCQNLARIGITLETLKLKAKQAPLDQLLARLSDTAALVEQTGDITRNIMEGLRPTVLDHYGLMGGLRYLGEQFIKKTGIDFEIGDANENIRLDPASELALFRITQEALANVVKHAKATSVRLYTEENNSKLRLIIADDGIGFDQSQETGKPTKGKKWGLMTIRERATAIGGTYHIESQSGKGTRVIVEVPG